MTLLGTKLDEALALQEENRRLVAEIGQLTQENIRLAGQVKEMEATLKRGSW